MEFYYLQGRLYFLFDKSVKNFSKNNLQRAVLFISILFFHCVLLIAFMRIQLGKHQTLSLQRTFTIVSLPPERNSPILELPPPSLNFMTHLTQIPLPNIEIAEAPTQTMNATSIEMDKSYELPNKSSNRYQEIFDPKLRQKLIDSEVFNHRPVSKKSNIWTEADGRVFVDVGNGNCMVTMPKIDSHERGAILGFTRCGKTDSEKFMDNVTTALEARKHSADSQ